MDMIDHPFHRVWIRTTLVGLIKSGINESPLATQVDPKNHKGVQFWSFGLHKNMADLVVIRQIRVQPYHNYIGNKLRYKGTRRGEKEYHVHALASKNKYIRLLSCIRQINMSWHPPKKKTQQSFFVQHLYCQVCMPIAWVVARTSMIGTTLEMEPFQSLPQTAHT